MVAMPAGRGKPVPEAADERVPFASARSVFEVRGSPTATPTRQRAISNPARSPNASLDSSVTSSGGPEARSRVGELKRLFQSGQPIPAEELTYCASMDSPLLARKRLLVMPESGEGSDIEVEPSGDEPSIVRLRQGEEEPASVQSRRAMFEAQRLSAGGRVRSAEGVDQSDRRLKSQSDQNLHQQQRPFSRGQLHDMPLIKHIQQKTTPKPNNNSVPNTPHRHRTSLPAAPITSHPEPPSVKNSRLSWTSSWRREEEEKKMEEDVEEKKMEEEAEEEKRRIFGDVGGWSEEDEEDEEEEEEDGKMVTFDLAGGMKNKEEIERFLNDSSDAIGSSDEEEEVEEGEGGGVVLISQKTREEDSSRDSGMHPCPPEESISDLPLLRSLEGKIDLTRRQSDTNRSCSPDQDTKNARSLSDPVESGAVDADTEDLEEEEEEEAPLSGHLHRSVIEDEGLVLEWRVQDRRPAVERVREVGCVDGVHYLEDGNFFYHKELRGFDESDDEAEEVWTDRSRKSTKVRFGDTPVLVYSTYSSNDYERGNDAIDPLSAAAEYELEKRLERMDRIDVDLNKGDYGLGISIVGLGAGQPSGVEKLGIFIKGITPGGAADVDGRMRVCDQIVEVDGQSLVGVSQTFAGQVLRNTRGLVHFALGRERDPATSDIVRLVDQVSQRMGGPRLPAPPPPPPPPPPIIAEPDDFPDLPGDESETDEERGFQDEAPVDVSTVLNGSVMTDSKIEQLVTAVDAETRELDKRRKNGRLGSGSSSDDEGTEDGANFRQLLRKLREAEETNDRLKEELEAAQRHVSDIEAREAETKKRLERSERRMAGQESQLRMMRQRLDGVEASDDTDGTSSSGLKLQEVKRQLDESRAAEQQLRDERDDLRSRLAAVDERYATLVSQLRDRVTALEAEVGGERRTEETPAPSQRRAAPAVPSGPSTSVPRLLSAGSLENIASVPTTDAVIAIDSSALPGEGNYKGSARSYSVAKAEMEAQISVRPTKTEQDLKSQPSQWTVEDVVRYLKTIDLHHLEQVVRMMAIDGETLLHLDGQSMKDKGIHNSTDRNILKRRIKDLNKSEEMRSPSVATKTKKSRFPFGK